MAAGDPPGQHLVVVGASAGGVEALRDLVAALPADFPAAIVVVLHIAPAGSSVLPQILGRAGNLPAVPAADGEALRGGRVYVAPPDRHVVVEDGHLCVMRGPSVNGHRPAIDPLFRSAAAAYGAHVAGVVLSGVLDDGTAGLLAVKDAGGRTLLQDPASALYAGMPSSAIEAVEPNFVGTAQEIGAALAEHASAPPDPPAPRARNGSEFVEVDRGSSEHPHPGGAPSGFTCPLCNGGLWELEEHGRSVYRCRTGHEFSVEALAVEQTEHVEASLWSALRALEEQTALHRRIAQRLARQGLAGSAARFARRADRGVQHAVALRRVLESTVLDPPLDEDVPEEAAS